MNIECFASESQRPVRLSIFFSDHTSAPTSWETHKLETMNSNIAEGTHIWNNHDKWGKESVRKKFKKPQKDTRKNKIQKHEKRSVLSSPVEPEVKNPPANAWDKKNSGSIPG